MLKYTVIQQIFGTFCVSDIVLDIVKTAENKPGKVHAIMKLILGWRKR